MAQLGRAASAAVGRRLNADVPELSARSCAEDNHHPARGFRGYETEKGDDMNSNWKMSSLSLSLVASLVSAAAPAQAPACKQPQYTVTDLGVLGKATAAHRMT